MGWGERWREESGYNLINFWERAVSISLFSSLFILKHFAIFTSYSLYPLCFCWSFCFKTKLRLSTFPLHLKAPCLWNKICLFFWLIMNETKQKLLRRTKPWDIKGRWTLFIIQQIAFLLLSNRHLVSRSCLRPTLPVCLHLIWVTSCLSLDVSAPPRSLKSSSESPSVTQSLLDVS